MLSIENLGVSCILVKNGSELMEKLKDQAFDFLFISFFLYKENRDQILKLGNANKIVVLAEFGETIPQTDLSVLAMPVYSVSIAAVLNGASDSFSFSSSSQSKAKFSAPDAKVLIVDDIKTNLKVAQGLLSPYNMQLVLCKSGREAVKLMQSKSFDLVFMDHKMPDMDGVEAVQNIRAMGDDDSYYKEVPIIALTADILSGSVEKFLEKGFDDFLSKPIDTIMLHAVLDKWIPQSKRTG